MLSGAFLFNVPIDIIEAKLSGVPRELRHHTIRINFWPDFCPFIGKLRDRWHAHPLPMDEFANWFRPDSHALWAKHGFNATEQAK
ncbi:MAG: hypothetical protein HOL61_13690 [Rhodospirillaceae bacterium]|nr:hypothetical protein [Rhodospirillaceae bacterium]